MTPYKLLLVILLNGVESLLMTLAPGAEDTVSHRHDCELLGYVLEGDIQIALVTKDPITFSTGKMFYEKRNILHTWPEIQAMRKRPGFY